MRYGLISHYLISDYHCTKTVQLNVQDCPPPYFVERKLEFGFDRYDMIDKGGFNVWKCEEFLLLSFFKFFILDAINYNH